MNTPFRVGLTGGIASGKSVVSAEFAKLGVPIIDGDVLAREVVQPGQPVLALLVKHFGPGILNSQGQLDRAKMRTLIFNDPAAKTRLENILHPAIRARQTELAATVGGPYQIHVMPLIAEQGSRAQYDRVLVVDSSRPTQLRRLLARDGITVELAERMLAAQADRSKRLAIADDIIDNEQSLERLPERVAELHGQYLRYSQAQTTYHDK